MSRAAGGITGISRAQARELPRKQMELTQPQSPELPTSVRYGHKAYGPQGTHTNLGDLDCNPISVACNSVTHEGSSRGPGSPGSSMASRTPRSLTVPEPFSFGESR
jgi:hypothetical protein